MVVSARRQDRLDDLVRQVARTGGQALAVAGDVTINAELYFVKAA